MVKRLNTKTAQIYCLIDPRDEQPFYVGATTTGLGNRLMSHIYESKGKPDDKKCQMILEIIKSGHHPLIQFIEKVPFKLMDETERKHITEFLKNGFRLLNKRVVIKHQDYIIREPFKHK